MRDTGKMKRQYIYILATILLAACNSSLSENFNDVSDGDAIQIGGVETDELSVSYEITRAADGAKQDAETVPWLLTPLKSGLDITYGKVNGLSTDNAVAKLKLVANNVPEDGNDYGTYDSEKEYNVMNGLAVYTFKTLNSSGAETTPAIWFGNGAHYFQGVYVPEKIRYGTSNTAKLQEDIEKENGTAPNLTTDLSETGDESNFTLLERYLGMPANTRISATVERIKLPFRHRLAHVIVYILIDPSISGATIKGYKGGKKEDGTFVNDTENPKTSSILFRNVMMLKGVEDDYNETTKLHTLTPQWEEKVPRVIPHFFGEHGSVYSNETPVTGAESNFILFTHNRTKAAIFPTDDGKWDQVKKDWEDRKKEYLDGHASDADKETKAIEHANAGTYTRVDYGLVPCYDIILRPTYTTDANVMYDEKDYDDEDKRKAIAALKNNIDFDIVLSNDLQYEKSVSIDLNANEETVVYLRISRESIDYNTSGAEKWIRDTAYDGWYGLNNKNGNTLSMAGSSWQRAYTFKKSDAFSETPGTSSGVTDGQFYNASSTHEERENAQYFNETYQAEWIKKFLQAYKGGAHHGDYFVLNDDITIDAKLIPHDFVFTGHLDGRDHTITLINCGYEWSEEVNVYKKIESIPADYTGKLYTRKSNGEYEEFTTIAVYEKLEKGEAEQWEWLEFADIENQKHYVADSEGREPGDPGYEKTYSDGYIEINESNPQPVYKPVYRTALQIQNGTYYTKGTDGNYHEYQLPDLYVYGPTTVWHLGADQLFSGLNGDYTTAQESPSATNNTVWEANVHQETNKSTIWVPVAGYRAEVLNVKVAGTGARLFKEDPSPYTGNVQNCFENGTAVPNHTPDMPKYK